MPDAAYLAAVLAVTFGITLALRAVPFAVLGSLRESLVVSRLAAWMPVGILAILAVTAFRSSVAALPGTFWYALIALAATVATHLALGRRTILSVSAGTATAGIARRSSAASRAATSRR